MFNYVSVIRPLIIPSTQYGGNKLTFVVIFLFFGLVFLAIYLTARLVRRGVKDSKKIGWKAWIPQPYKSRVGRQKLLKPKSDKRFNVIAGGWLLSGYLLALYIVDNGVLFSDCVVCTEIAAYMPQIHRMAIGSRYSEAMHYVWLYFLVTAPLILVVLFVLVTEFHDRIIRKKSGVFVFITLSLFGGYVCIFGMDFGIDGGGFSKYYSKNLVYSVFIAGSAPASVIFSIFHLTHHFIGVLRKESKASQEN